MHSDFATDTALWLGAPEFERKPCRNLERFTLKHCHGLLYKGPREPVQDMAGVFARPEFDFSGYVLDHTETHTCHYNWKTFIEVYLEDYHVAPFHPELGKFVTCAELDWEFAETYSMQRVGVHNALALPGSEIYRKWHDRSCGTFTRGIGVRSHRPLAVEGGIGTMYVVNKRDPSTGPRSLSTADHSSA